MILKRPLYSTRAEGKGFAIYQSDKALKTPLLLPLIVSSRALAEAIAEEFEAMGNNRNLRAMPYTQMALTAIDIAAPKREEVIAGILRYGETELICQRASDPADLVAEQNKKWQPYLDWCKERFGADLKVGSGIIPFEQDKTALAALRAFVETLDAFFLTGLSEACRALGSLVLGLALMEGKAPPSEAFEAAECDPLWQSKKWGDDPFLKGRQTEIARDLNICAEWFALLRK
jgi:chaperone required for assembly of F1-ATPase